MSKKIIALAQGKEAPEEPKQTGRPKKVLTKEYIHAMCKFALDRVKAGEPVTAQLLQHRFKGESAGPPCLTVLKEDIKKTGLRDIAKIFCMTAMKLWCTETNMSNVVGWTTLVVKVCSSKPRCFSINHTVTLTTMLKEPGMFLVSRRCSTCKIDKRQTQPYSRSSLYEKHTRGVPELVKCVKDAKIARDYNDYHGNFNADLFKRLLECLCKKLESLGFGCIIHTDNAKSLSQERLYPNQPS
ncbi:hypothetical protein BJV82DRAFT_671741 [Fennellomyces sp. T-0311]|nr:hypothetical protein BJV82DRAFT_671741 [Fennellomyces sp. T-0311]